MEIEPIDELIHVLFCLRQKKGWPEIPFWIPFDNPGIRDRSDYISFAWHPVVSDIIENASEYTHAKKERLTFANEVRRFKPREELEDLFIEYKKLLAKLCNLSGLAQNTLHEHGFNLEHFLTLDRAMVNILLPLHESTEEIEKTISDLREKYWEDWEERREKPGREIEEEFFRDKGQPPIEKLQKPGKGRPKEPEKEVFLDKIVDILRLHIGEIPTQDEVEKLCKAIFGEDCGFNAEEACKRAYQNPLPSDILLWFRKRGIDPESIPEGNRWSIFSEACKYLYDRPERLRRGLKPLDKEVREKLYRSIWAR